MGEKNPLIGKKVVAVYLASDDKAIRFDLEDGESVVARADADCCSSTWIESLDAPELIVEGVVTGVDNLSLPGPPDQPDYGLIQQYGCKITTTKGRCVIDYRNESNGYYGGWLHWPGVSRSFYGGVYGQNVSNEDWVLIARNAERDPHQEEGTGDA